MARKPQASSLWRSGAAGRGPGRRVFSFRASIRSYSLHPDVNYRVRIHRYVVSK